MELGGASSSIIEHVQISKMTTECGGSCPMSPLLTYFLVSTYVHKVPMEVYGLARKLGSNLKVLPKK